MTWMRRTLWTTVMALLLTECVAEARRATGMWTVVAAVVVAGVLVWAAAWWRRLDADGVGAVCFVLGACQLAFLDSVLEADVLALVALYSVGERGRRRLTPVWLVLLVAGAVSAALDWNADEKGTDVYYKDLVTSLLLVLGTGLIAWMVGRLVAQRRSVAGAREAEAAARRAEEDQRHRAELVAVRTEIAQEVHDVVGHALALIAVQAEAGHYLSTVEPDESRLDAEERLQQVGDTLGTVLTTARRALEETRALTRSLAASAGQGGHEGHSGEARAAAPVRPVPDLDDLPSLVRSAAEAGAPVELRTSGAHPGLSVQAQLALYRVAQEGITNAVKHAPGATRVLVDLDCSPESAVLRVSDDDASERPPGTPTTGQGLRNLRYRVEAVGGTLRVGAVPGGGVLLEARVPARASDAEETGTVGTADGSVHAAGNRGEERTP